ncbi:MAG: peptidyl-prolyl cis-trans isomerase A (cyclophilin A) [Candidatus Saganbacteria bacterium]|uniref:Peptidyl-prolyl cis-trans isomerase n=1 Tax=Candidatus Saganbacteria bacterium TaxID=2575572 RepID=A0A833NZR3_UNCSA|nr:MAG: peptidyl-prolyl cis-trans isomerase A (cyclophilin A) [Candidatus Saganbacteria bacterium]
MKKIFVGLFVILISLNGLSAEGKIKMKKTYATFETSMGKIVCELFPGKAPKTVKNFAALAKGEQGWLDPKSGEIEKKPLYDGTIFHRVIPDFMIQGGDPMGNGMGGPGYKFNDEFADDLKFDISGRLAMANSGPNTNGSQFFITLAATPWLNSKHTIFGQVMQGQDIVEKISMVARSQNDRPAKEVVLKKVTITEK